MYPKNQVDSPVVFLVSMAELEQFCMSYLLNVLFWDLLIFMLLLTQCFSFSTLFHHITTSAESASVESIPVSNNEKSFFLSYFLLFTFILLFSFSWWAVLHSLTSFPFTLSLSILSFPIRVVSPLCTLRLTMVTWMSPPCCWTEELLLTSQPGYSQIPTVWLFLTLIITEGHVIYHRSVHF